MVEGTDIVVEKDCVVFAIEIVFVHDDAEEVLLKFLHFL